MPNQPCPITVLVTGATGLVGSCLVSRLKARGHGVFALRRSEPGPGSEPTWDPSSGRLDLKGLKLDAVVHLAGENIAQRWTPAAKARIRSSRVDGTQILSRVLSELETPPSTLICASATGFYGDRGTEVLDEQSGPGTGFLAEVCQAWEAAADPAQQRGIRVVHLRLGIVLTSEGGALARMLPVFRWGLGGRLGTGKQFWGWITLEDLLGVIEWSLQEADVSGAVNAVAPEETTNAAFTRELARAVGRPALFPVPALAVRTVFGEFGREALLASARVRPERLLGAGFTFRFPDLASALDHAVQPGMHSK